MSSHFPSRGDRGAGGEQHHDKGELWYMRLFRSSQMHPMLILIVRTCSINPRCLMLVTPVNNTICHEMLEGNKQNVKLQLL